MKRVTKGRVKATNWIAKLINTLYVYMSNGEFSLVT